MNSQFKAKEFEQTSSSSRKKSTLLIQPGDFQSSQKYVIGPKITLPSGQLEKVEVRTDYKPAVERQKRRLPISLFQTEPTLPAAVKRKIDNSSTVDQIKARQLSMASRLPQEEEEALTVQTFPLRAVKSKRAIRMFRLFLAGVILFCMSVLAFATGAALIFIVPGILYKSTVFMIMLIVLSYLASFQVKRAYQARHRYLSMKQLMNASDEKDVAGEDDLQHLTLIKQDTTGYLRALTTDQLKKGLRK